MTPQSQPPRRRGERPAPGTTAALFVRIPAEQANRLDRAAFELKMPKQRLVADLLDRYVNPQSLASLQADRDTGDTLRRVTVEALDPSTMTVGHHSFRPREPEVLTAEEVAELLQVDASTVLELSAAGELPGRKLGGEWRFARAAVLKWLAAEDPRDTGTGESHHDR